MMKGANVDALKDVQRKVQTLGIDAVRGKLEAARSRFATKAELDVLRQRIESAEQRAFVLEGKLAPKPVIEAEREKCEGDCDWVL
jgi:hypothetical protein